MKNVREAGFMEKKDLRENLIKQAPNLRVSGVGFPAYALSSYGVASRCQEVSIEHRVRSQKSEVRNTIEFEYWLQSEGQFRNSQFSIRNSQSSTYRFSVSPRLPAIGFAFRRGGRVVPLCLVPLVFLPAASCLLLANTGPVP